MIGTTHFENLCAFYFAMLALIWMLVDSVYHIIRPLESSGKNVSDKSGAKNDLENSTGKFEFIQETHLSEEKSDLNSIYGNIQGLGQNVNPEVNYLSKQKLTSACKNTLPRKRLLLKRDRVETMCLPCEVVSCNNEEATNLMVVKNSVEQNSELLLKKTQVETRCLPYDIVPSINEEDRNLTIVKTPFNQKSELQNNLVFSIRGIRKLVNINELAIAKENSIIFTSYHPAEYNGSELVKFKVQDVGFKNLRKKSISFSDQTQKHSRKQIKQDSNEILTLRKTAHYIINQMDIEIKSHLKKQFDEMEISDFFYIDKGYSDLSIKQNNKYREPSVIITELDSSDEIDAQRKQKTQRKKKNKKKNKKSKFINQKVESISATFSTKQCFERLAFFMNTNQKLTQSKMMFEIEKELKPIKDKINELRESMTDFVVVNERTDLEGVMTSKLSVQPFAISGIRSKSILTVPSVSLRRLAQLADTSNNLQENGCSEIIESEPKKLSHLAEMYIKLSRQ